MTTTNLNIGPLQKFTDLAGEFIGASAAVSSLSVPALCSLNADFLDRIRNTSAEVQDLLAEGRQAMVKMLSEPNFSATTDVSRFPEKAYNLLAINMLSLVLDHPDNRIRKNAIDALAKFGEEAFSALFRAALTDGHWPNMERAESYLTKLKGVEPNDKEMQLMLEKARQRAGHASFFGRRLLSWAIRRSVRPFYWLLREGHPAANSFEDVFGLSCDALFASLVKGPREMFPWGLTWLEEVKRAGKVGRAEPRALQLLVEQCGEFLEPEKREKFGRLVKIIVSESSSASERK